MNTTDSVFLCRHKMCWSALRSHPESTKKQPPSCIQYEICITVLQRESDIASVNKEMYFIPVALQMHA